MRRPTILDTLLGLDNQIGYFNAWVTIPGVTVFKYNDICFDTESVVSRIAAQIGAQIDVDDVLKTFRDNKITDQFNKGKALRYSEMPEKQQQIFLKRYVELYQKYAFDTERAFEIAETQKSRTFRARGRLAINPTSLRRRFRF